jgi:hypothetical protein
MMPLSTSAKNTALDALPNTVFVAFFTGGAPGAGTEVVPATLWGSGDRPSIALGAAASGARSPNGDAALGTVDIASQAVDHVAYYDAATGGNLLGYDAYSRTLASGDVVSYPDANNVFELTDAA